MIRRMRRVSLRTVLLLAGLGVSNALLSPGVSAQDPARDLPHQRVPGLTKAKALQLGLERLQAGWDWEAARMFRELLVRDERMPLPHLLLALAMRDVPNRAARHCWDAMQRQGNAAPGIADVLRAYQEYFGVTDQPELTDARFQKQPLASRRAALVRSLRMLDGGPASSLSQSLVAIELAEERGTGAKQQEVGLLMTGYNSYLSGTGAMPFQVPGYETALKRRFDKALVAAMSDLTHTSPLQMMPRHPQYPATKRVVAHLPGWPVRATDKTGLPWQPRKAAGFKLPRGLGGSVDFANYKGKPVLVVFFLGFGCAHCVAQLADLDPKADNFREAGIEVLTIGTDDLNQVRAARQAADENGVDPLHFDVLCDPKGDVFKKWGVWDEFSNEALHGTFLVDGKGRILWQDVSLRPFEESDWLLAESKRLLEAWSE